MENYVERIRQLCKDRNISVAKMEEDLGYGNGYLNPKKVSDIKTGRLIEILEYIGVSYEEFMNIGSKETQQIMSALVQIKKANQATYEDLLQKWFFAEPKDFLTEREKTIIELFRLFNEDGQKTIIGYVESLLNIPTLLKEKNNADTTSVSA